MKRFMLLFALFACTLAYADVPKTGINYDTVQPATTLSKTLRDLVDDINTEFDVANIIGPGDAYYVNTSSGSDTYTGKDWAHAKATLDAAIGLCTDNHGDVIYVKQASSHTMGAAADEVDVDVDGVTIIGCGTPGDREDMPIFDYTGDVTGAFAVGADGVTLYNLRFHANVPDVNEAIEVEAGSTDLHIVNCVFDAETEGTDEFLECIDTSGGAASDRLWVVGCQFDMGAGAANSAICMKDSDYAYIAKNITAGDYAVACINQVTTASNHITIEKNILFNGTIGGAAGLNDQPCIEVLATTSGVIADNALFTNVATPDAAIVALDMYCIGNVYSETEGGVSVAPMWLTTDTVDNVIGLNDASNLGVTTSVTADGDGSMLERQEYVQFNQDQIISKTATADDDDLFAVAGGPIEILSIWGVVTATIDANAATIRLIHDATAPYTDHYLTETVTFNDVAAGSVISVDPNTTAPFMAALTTHATGTELSSQPVNFFVGIGSIEQDVSAANLDGVVVWYMKFRPLTSSSVVTAQ